MSDDKTKATEKRVEEFRGAFTRTRKEIERRIVGQGTLVDGVLTCLAGGRPRAARGRARPGQDDARAHPGGGACASSSRASSSRPTSCPPTSWAPPSCPRTRTGKQKLEFRKGPIFANIVLADEVNRATPKTQSALLEVMQEHAVTIGGETLPAGAAVLRARHAEPARDGGHLPAARGPARPLPLQARRWKFPSHAALSSILDRTTGSELPVVTPVLGKDEVLSMRALARDVPVPEHVKELVIRVLEATHPDHPSAPERVKRFVRYGASPAARSPVSSRPRSPPSPTAASRWAWTTSDAP
jgi:MoxR-like ATPase